MPLTNLRRSTGLHYILALSFAVSVLSNGCNQSGKADRRNVSSKVELRKYYPLDKLTRWTFKWNNRRGDDWEGTLIVTDKYEDGNSVVILVTDTVIRMEGEDSSRSAYVWGDSALEHLYRVTNVGDSTSFSPPRIVIPAYLTQDQPLQTRYGFRVFNNSGTIKLAGNVEQLFTFSGFLDLKTRHGEWKKCAVVEVEQTYSYEDSPGKTTSTVYWLAKSIGPVKIVSGRAVNDDLNSGDEMGLLVTVE